jgi:PiT family inorganic phosphate transporter
MYAKMKARHKELGPNERLPKRERKAFKKVAKKELVKRSVLMRIMAAWVITVPATAILAAGMYGLLAAFL